MVNGGGRPINDADTETIWITGPLRLVPQDMTRVLLNLFSNGFSPPPGARGARRRMTMSPR